MILRKWRSPVESELKRTILTEYKAIVAQISEAHSTIKHLTPRHDIIAKMIETYGWLAEIEKLGPDDDTKGNTEESRTKGAKIADFAKDFFANNRNQWTRLSDLFVYLTEQGINIGGKNPNSTLSAHLSNAGLFEGDRTKGWRLKSEHLPTPPLHAPGAGAAKFEFLK